MESNKAAIAALEAAVDSMPENSILRQQLALLLHEGGNHAASLGHCVVGLHYQPQNDELLELAARCAAAMGAAGLSNRYQSDSPATPSPFGEEAPPADEQPTLPQPAPITTDGDVGVDNVDDFLESVFQDVTAEAERNRLTLDDIAGLADVKQRLNASFLAPLRNPELRAMYGKSLRGGLLLYGPPGCGKTHVARAVAGELGANFYSIGLNDILDMWMGKSEQNLHAIFELSRRNSPSVLFLDEVDALGQKRSQLQHSGGRNVVVQLLTELDGLATDNEGLFILGATNQPWDIDSALRRPGRFDRMVLVTPPDEEARARILELEMRNRPTAAIDYREIAGKTDRLSGADLRLLCDAATEHAMESAVASGKVRPVNGQDFKAALKNIRASTGPWFETARNYVTFANESGQYDDLLAYMRSKKLL